MKGKIFLTFRIGKIIKEDNRALHSAAFDGLRTETENEKINDLTEIDLILIKITMSLILHFILNSRSEFFEPNMKSGLIIVPNMKS